MGFESKHWMFRALTDEEETQFRTTARKLFEEITERNGNVAALPIDFDVWHPICRDEWHRLFMQAVQRKD